MSASSVAGGLAAAAVAIVLLVLLGVGVWQFNWFMAEKNQDRQTQVDNGSLAFQTGLVDQVTNGQQEIARIDLRLAESPDPAVAAALDAQRSAILTDVCEAAGKLSGKVDLPSASERLVSEECI